MSWIPHAVASANPLTHQTELMSTQPTNDASRNSLVEQLAFRLRRLGLSEYGLFLILAALIGLFTGCGVVAFRELYESITRLALGEGSVLAALAAQPAWRIVLVPALGGLVVGLLLRILPRGASGEHGVARVIFAVARNDGRIPFVSTLRSFLTNAVSIGTGASVGPEGPVIELGSGLGSATGQWLRLSPERMRTLVGCGAAAGLAAAFNAPISGAIFALEIVLRDFAVVTFAPIIVAAVLGTALSRALLGGAPTFAVPSYELFSVWELPLYVVLGLAAGVVGVIFTRLTHAGERLRPRIPGPQLLRPMFGGAVLGTVFLGLPQLFGVGYESAGNLLHGELDLLLMAAILIAKLLATSFTLACGFTGGIFAPTLLIGGALGGIAGHLAGLLFPAHTAPIGAYSLVGMAALMAAVTHAPMTSILILFEMTGGYEVILPLMLACIGSVIVAQRGGGHSMFTIGLAHRGVDLNFGRESAILRDYFVEDIMQHAVATVPPSTGLEAILDRFLERSDDRYYVVDEAGVLLGVIDLHDIKAVLHDRGLQGVIIAADLMHPVSRCVHRRENLEEAILLLGSADAEELPVVSEHETPHLEGTISRKLILELYNREILQKEVLGIKLARPHGRGADIVDLPEQYRVDLIDVNAAMAGRSLAQLDLRERFGVHVLAIKRRGVSAAGRNELPDPKQPLTIQDRLIIVGRSEAVDRLKEAPASSE